MQAARDANDVITHLKARPLVTAQCDHVQWKVHMAIVEVCRRQDPNQHGVRELPVDPLQLALQA